MTSNGVKVLIEFNMLGKAMKDRKTKTVLVAEVLLRQGSPTEAHLE